MKKYQPPKKKVKFSAERRVYKIIETLDLEAAEKRKMETKDDSEMETENDSDKEIHRDTEKKTQRDTDSSSMEEEPPRPTVSIRK